MWRATFSRHSRVGRDRSVLEWELENTRACMHDSNVSKFRGLRVVRRNVQPTGLDMEDLVRGRESDGGVAFKYHEISVTWQTLLLISFKRVSGS